MNQFKRNFVGASACVALALASATAMAAGKHKPDALLSIDLNRAAVVEKIVSAWGNEIPAAQRESFKTKLQSLRADHLLSANLSGSFEGVLEVLNAHESAQKINALPAAQNGSVLGNISEKIGTDKAKALGDATADLVYTPITPCRLFDTRAGQVSALGVVGGTFSNQQRRSIVPSGACGIPTTGVASLFLSYHAYTYNPAVLGVIGFMKPGDPFSALAGAWTGGVWVTSTYITSTSANGNFDAFVGNGSAMTADMIVDVMGYFRAPQGTIGDITDIQTAAGSGLTGGVTSGAVSLSLANSYKLPQSCANAQVPKFNSATSLWECQNDLQGTGAGGTGTVTNIATGAGLTGGPITTTGTIGLAATQLLPTTACTNGQVAKWNGTAWACGTDAIGTGTVSSVTAGTGLTGGTILTTGTISADTTFLQRRVSATCAVGSSIRAIAADGTVTCQTDSAGPTNAWAQGGNAFGATGVIGTTDAQNLTVQSGGNQASLVVPGGNGLRVIQTTGGNTDAPNVINGSANNSASGQGATVAGGGRAGTDCTDPVTLNNTRNCRNEALSDFATVGGGSSNTASGIDSTVGGGASNTASSSSATVGGGRRNIASASSATVGGGISNTASGIESTLGGGSNNTASGNFATVGGGFSNTASQSYATVSGGTSNTASGKESTLGGGSNNTASGNFATVGGGSTNTASESYATVSGGRENTASQSYATVSGGRENTASGFDAAVGGGRTNTASGSKAVVSGGEVNAASADYATVAGGGGNKASASAAAVGGGGGNTASGVYSTVTGGEAANARLYGQHARAAGAFVAGTPGTAQHADYVLRRVTADATPVDLKLDGATADLVFEPGRMALLDVMVAALDNSSGAYVATYTFKCMFQVSPANITYLQPSGCSKNVLYEDFNAAAWDANVSAAGGVFKITATGSATQTIRWVATVRAVEVKW